MELVYYFILETSDGPSAPFCYCLIARKKYINSLYTVLKSSDKGTEAICCKGKRLECRLKLCRDQAVESTGKDANFPYADRLLILPEMFIRKPASESTIGCRKEGPQQG